MLTEQAKALGIHKSQNPPFEKVAKEIKRLENRDIEKQAEESEPNVAEDSKPEINTADNQDSSDDITVTADLDDIKFLELKKIAKEKGIEYGRSTTKEELITAIKNVE